MKDESVSARKAAEQIKHLFRGYHAVVPTEEIERIISAACSPVAPDWKNCKHPFVWPDGDCVDCGVLATTMPGHTEPHHIMVPRKFAPLLERKLPGATPAVTPRCPKCGSENIRMSKRGDVVCGSPPEHVFVCNSLADYAQFFRSAPAQPQWEELKRRIRERYAMAEKLNNKNLQAYKNVLMEIANLESAPVVSPQGEGK